MLETGESSREVTVTGVTGQVQKQTFLHPRECQPGGQNLGRAFSGSQIAPLRCWAEVCFVNCMPTRPFPQETAAVCVVPLKRALHLQAFLTCPGGPRGDPCHLRSANRSIKLFGLMELQVKQLTVQPIKINLQEAVSLRE